MAGNKAGGLKCRDTNYNKHGADFYRQIGAKGGRAKVPKGFALNPELARVAVRSGGINGVRASKKQTIQKRETIQKLLKRGWSVREIANKLKANQTTIRYHIRKIEEAKNERN